MRVVSGSERNKVAKPCNVKFNCASVTRAKQRFTKLAQKILTIFRKF